MQATTRTAAEEYDHLREIYKNTPTFTGRAWQIEQVSKDLRRFKISILRNGRSKRRYSVADFNQEDEFGQPTIKTADNFNTALAIALRFLHRLKE